MYKLIILVTKNLVKKYHYLLKKFELFNNIYKMQAYLLYRKDYFEKY